MNAALHLPNNTRPASSLSRQTVSLLSAFAAILITLQGLLGPNQEPVDDFTELPALPPHNRAAGA